MLILINDYILHYMLGMAVAEIMSQKLNPDLEQPLQFTYDSTSELDTFKSMLSPPEKPQANSYRLNDTSSSQSDNLSVTQSPADDQSISTASVNQIWLVFLSRSYVCLSGSGVFLSHAYLIQMCSTSPPSRLILSMYDCTGQL